MARLEIRLLGPFEVALDGELVTGFETNSARALLAYLASEPGRARPRPVVAETLWPDRPQGAALSNLRHVLSVLRRALGDRDSAHPVLITDGGSVAIAASDEVWVDLVEFERLAGTPADTPGVVEEWNRAVDLWRGPLLEGLTVRAGAEWEEWLVVTAERVRRRLAVVLRRLADHHERAGAWELAIPTLRRLTEVDPWDERGHRQLMRLLARTGEGARALVHFTDLEERLLSDLGAEPAPETLALVDQIRAGDLTGVAFEVEVVYPAFLAEVAPRVEPLFVDRRAELDQLRVHLDAAMAGRGRMVFVSGEAGSGKTMLTGKLTRGASEVPDLLVARGRCNAFGGLGDPYLPFREVLNLLCGDVESGYTSGDLDREQATRLWESIPHSARLVAEVGPSLVGVMVNGGLLLERTEKALPGAKWIEDLRARLEALVGRPPVAERLQPALFDEYTAVLERLAITRPLLLVVDDLQWADRGSVALLWHLARRIEGSRILVVGVYRSEDIDPEPGDTSSLGGVLRELRSATPDCVIELEDDRRFIDEYLDSEPNELDEEFRDRLFAYTGGHPLFTVELVRGMQERGEIRRDKAGVWRVRGSLDWGRVPSRVEAAIARRIARLPEPLQRDLVVASVQGEEFVAEVVAEVGGDAEVPARLSLESGTPHRLIEPPRVARVDGRLAARHRFRHVLYQRYLYERLDGAERMRLHEATARALEDLYRGQPEPPVVDLARHFDEAGLVDSAVGYFQSAGQRALQMSAPEEAIRLLERGLALLSSLPDSTERDERELALLVSLSAAVMAVRGYAAPEAERIGRRVAELCDHLEPSAMVAMALLGLASVLNIRGRYRRSVSVCTRALKIAEAIDEPALRLMAHQSLGYSQTWVGDLAAGHTSLQSAQDLYDPVEHAWLRHVFGSAVGPEALVWDAVNTLQRGYPEQAQELADRGIAVARETGHAFTLCHALAVGGVVVHAMAGDFAVEPFIDEVEAIAEVEHFPFFQVAVSIYRGQVAGYLGDPETGIAAIGRGLDEWQAMGVEAFRGQFLGQIADFEIEMDRATRGLERVEVALGETRESGERLTEVYLEVQRGKLLGALGADAAAVDALEAAIEAAQAIGARLVELRAATELATVLGRLESNAEAEAVLTSTYSRFTEGFDTPYLAAVRAVLEEL